MVGTSVLGVSLLVGNAYVGAQMNAIRQKFEDRQAVHTAIAFLASAVKCGENWTDECERVKTEGLRALERLTEKATLWDGLAESTK